MDWINKYWKIITTVIVVVLGIGGLQAQVAQNSAAIENKADATVVTQLQKDMDEAKEQAEKDFAEAKKEREALEEEQKKQTEIRVNQRHIKDDLNETKQENKDIQKAIQNLINEIRSKP